MTTRLGSRWSARLTLIGNKHTHTQWWDHLVLQTGNTEAFFFVDWYKSSSTHTSHYVKKKSFTHLLTSSTEGKKKGAGDRAREGEQRMKLKLVFISAITSQPNDQMTSFGFFTLFFCLWAFESLEKAEIQTLFLCSKLSIIHQT